MAASNAKTLLLTALVGLSLRTSETPAAAPHARTEPIVLDAQSADADLASNNVLFRKVKITQGDMAISADQGQGTQQKTRLDFDNSLWVFRGSVKISMADGQLNSDDAEISFVNQLLSKAVVNGKPATFQQRVQKTGKLAQGHADVINYDAGKGVIVLSKSAWLTDGQYEIRGESLKYNMVAQSIVADAADQGSQRVHIVIPPPPPKP
jgi:lipopolysaccharide transport protein LptA